MRALRSGSAYDGEKFLTEGATVLIEGETIVGVEPATYDVPSDCPVTTYDGTLMPGLIDAHVHLVAAGNRGGEPGSLENAGPASDDELDALIVQALRDQAAGGVTTVRDLGDSRYRTLLHRDRQAPGLPRIRAAGPPLTTPGGHCFYLGGVVSNGVEAAVAEHVERGVDVIKVMASGGMLTPGSDQLGAQFELDVLRRIVEAAHAAGLKIYAHSHSLVGIRDAVQAGVDGIEHFTGLAPDGPTIPDDLLEEIARKDIAVDPTLSFDPARLPPPGLVPPPMMELLTRLGLGFETRALVRGDQVRRAREHGVRVVSGLDAGAAPPKPHGGLWRAVVELTGPAGYPVDEALATATSVAADDLGVPAGRLRPGLSADLLVLDGNLQSDPSALEHPVAVVLRGQPLT
jgi:imidazolonepropionase-like amidohydrolase